MHQEWIDYLTKLYENEIAEDVKDGHIHSGRVVVHVLESGEIAIDKFIVPMKAIEYIPLQITVLKDGIKFE